MKPHRTFDANESPFDIYFVLPHKAKHRLDALTTKLAEAGKQLFHSHAQLEPFAGPRVRVHAEGMDHLTEDQLAEASVVRGQGQELLPWVTDHLSRCWQCRFALELEDGWTSMLIDRIMGQVGEKTQVVEKTVVSMK